MLPAFASERFVITVETQHERRKVFQILFRRTDGSLFVAFPYYQHACGLLTLATLKANLTYPRSLSLLDGGKVTGHRVKYSHHPDGAVHFSQDGKIRTKVRKASVPLSEAEGHIFTIQLQGLSDFSGVAENEQKPLLSAKKTILNFRFEGKPPEAVKFVGNWYRKSSLSERIVQTGNRPWFICEKPDGSKAMGMLIIDPFLAAHEECYLLLTCEGVSLLDREGHSTLNFIGGFDPAPLALNHGRDTSFLALAYPASESYEEMVKMIGTVDHVRPRSI